MRTEFSHVPFDGDLTDDKIVCQNCGWSWNKKDGGNDLFMCHRCNADNSDFYLLNSNFEGADYSQAITQGVSAIGSIGSSVAQAKATKEASKTNTQREVDAVCGKDKSRAWSKKKKQAYISCKNSVLDKLDTNVRLSNQQQQKNQQLQQLALLQKNKQQRNQTYLIIGVVALILGVVIYKKNKQMKNDLPISPNKKFKYSITFQSWDEESLEIGETDDKGFDVENEVESIGDILYSANTTYGIYYPVSFGIWESTEPVEDSKFYEKGIRTYYSLHISNEDGTPISEEENSFITFLLSDGRYEIDKFREFAIGGIVLGSIALGVGALIAYVYFKDKKIDSQSKEVEHNGRKYPTKGAWKKEHNLENKNEEHEVPQGERKLENGGDTSVQISKDDYFLVVRNWVYFTFNYPMGFVKDAFGNSHFESKFTSSYDRFGSMGALVNFWGNLSGDNRLVLSTWIKNNYVNIKSDESQLKSISDDDYSRIITHWNMFCYNYPNNFVNEAFDDSKHLLNKWNEAYNVASSTGAVNKFFSELSGDNQKILTDWIFENYKGSKFKFGGSVDLKNKEKEDMFLYLDENNWTIQTFMEKYNKTEDESDKIIDSWALARGVREYAGGGDVNDIDMEGIEKSAKFYADETRWTVPPTVEKFEAEIKEYQDLKKQLDNKEITPSKIIGKGHKSQYARGLAYKWIKERILIAEKAIEILQSRYADGGEINTVSELYSSKQAQKYPYATDMVAYFIFGDKEDNKIADAIRGRFSNQTADESALSEIMLQYEYSWQDNMEEIQEQTISELGDLIDYYAGGGRVTTNDGIIEAFLTTERELKVGNLSTHINESDNEVLLRNYGTLIATRKGNDVKINKNKYSVTTTTITNKVKRFADKNLMNVSYVDKFEEGGEVDKELIDSSAKSIYDKHGIMELRNVFLKTAQTDEMSGDKKTADYRRKVVSEYQSKQPKIMEEGGDIINKMSYDDFVETLQPYEIEGGFGSNIEKGFRMYYLPDNHPFFNKKFKHQNKRKAYNEYLKSFSEKFEEGGEADAIEYSEILEVLKDKIDNSISDVPNKYEESYNFTGEEVEHEFHDGFTPWTNGGYEARWFEYVGSLYGSGYSLPTKPLSEEMNRQINNNLESAKELFMGKYPEIVNELGEDNIDYNSLIEAGYDDEAEELSEMESDGMYEDSIMMRIFAHYFSPSNYRGLNGKHTIRLFGDVNLESPYHRVGNLDDSYEYEFTFDNIDELESEMDKGLEKVISWFNGEMFNDSKAEMKIRKMAKGGMTEHGLKEGDKIVFDHLVDENIDIIDKEGNKHIIDLDKGVRYEKGGEANNLLIKDWYTKNYPDDDLGEKINDNVTFKDLWSGIHNVGVYTVIGVGDSVIRERLFEKLAEIKDVRYDIVYNEWLNSDEYAKGGFVSKGELVWKKLSSAQKMEFLSENFTLQITPRSQEKLVGKSYNFLPKNVKITLESKYANVEEYAEGGEAEKEGKNGYIAFYKDKQMEVYADTSLQARNKASKLFKAKKDWEVTVVLAEIEGKQVVHDATFETGGEVQDWMEEALESLIEETGNETLDITMVSNQDNEFIASNENEEYRVFKTEHDAEIVAENEVRDMMEESPENFNKDFIINYVDGKNYFKQELDEMNNGYAEDIKSESDSTYANRLIAEMVENGIMSEDDAESDNAEELAEENIGEFVELMTQGQLDEGSDGFDYFTSNFGEEETMRIVIDNNLIDIFKASKDAVAEDGIAHFLSSYDGETVYLSNDVVAYRVN